jgi:hypothetical protein
METECSLPHSKGSVTCPYPKPDQSTPASASQKSILILYFHLRLGVQSSLVPRSCSTKTLYEPLFSLLRVTCPAHLQSFEKSESTNTGTPSDNAEDLIFWHTAARTSNVVWWLILWLYKRGSFSSGAPYEEGWSFELSHQNECLQTEENLQFVRESADNWEKPCNP